MNILFVAENYPPHYGGAEVVFEATCEGLAKKHKVSIVTHHIKGTKYRENKNRVDVIRVPCFGSRYLFTFIAPFWTLWHARKKDVIHTTTYNGAGPAWIAGLLTHKPVVITVHETWLGQWKKFTDMTYAKTLVHEVLERPIWWLHFTQYLCVSQSTKKQLENVLPKKLHTRISVNYNGFDDHMWKKASQKGAIALRKKLKLQKRFVVFAYGRPGPSKGYRYLMQAIQPLSKKIKNFHFVVHLTKNKQTRKEREKLLSLLPKKNVTILSDLKHEEKPTYVKMANCIVVPSLCEGFGYTTLEAAATKTPVVATNRGSIPEVICSKHLLIKARSSQAIVEAVLSVKKKKYKNTKYKKFLWSDNLKRVEKIYKKCKKIYKRGL